MATIGVPTALQFASANNTIAMTKVWGHGPLAWIDAGGRPKGYKFRQHLTSGAGAPAGLFAEGYYKPAGVPGERDKLSLSLLDRGDRLLGIDENGVARHMNHVGVGRAFYGQVVGHPHLHTPSLDGLCGYAEPLPVEDLNRYWLKFLKMANIHGAPGLSLPVVQGSLKV